MIKFTSKKALIPAIIQHFETLEVLMLAYVNEEAFKQTLETGLATFWSRSRKKLWVKGKEKSGNYLHVLDMKVDCDGDALVLLVDPDGPACHTGEPSCFYNSLANSLALELFIAYDHLLKNDLSKKSKTSKLLHSESPPFFEKRIKEEFKELKDVISGKHKHSGDTFQDMILEASQVWYWIVLWQLSKDESLDSIPTLKYFIQLKKIIEQNNCSIERVLYEDYIQMKRKKYI